MIFQTDEFLVLLSNEDGNDFAVKQVFYEVECFMPISFKSIGFTDSKPLSIHDIKFIAGNVQILSKVLVYKSVDLSFWVVAWKKNTTFDDKNISFYDLNLKIKV